MGVLKIKEHKKSTPTGAPNFGFAYGFRSLVVAFSMALLFRGFVVEGFVIPTGSMGPTLLGEHYRLYGKETGVELAIGRDRRATTIDPLKIADPLLGYQTAIQRKTRLTPKIRTGDRILVLKTLYLFQEPQRFDITVFTNPTNSQGTSRNYVKRLIGLPNEKLWIANGDVFASKGGSRFQIQRKPKPIQNKLWQTIFNSDHTPSKNSNLKQRGWPGNYWNSSNESNWSIDSHGYAFTTRNDLDSTLSWNKDSYPNLDWLSYNQATPEYKSFKKYPVSDLLLECSVIPSTNNVQIKESLETHSHIFSFIVYKNKAIITMGKKNSKKVTTVSSDINPIVAKKPIHIKFGHADQRLWVEINQKNVVELLYDWTPKQRLEYASGLTGKSIKVLEEATPSPPSLALTLSGGAATVKHLKVYKDLYWRPSIQRGIKDEKSNTSFTGKIGNGEKGYGTSSENIAVLGKDQFYFLGDNSSMSLDSRLWGWPDQYVSQQLDPSPFIVDRKLLTGKAWTVYFPALLENDYNSWLPVPDFGRIRFIK